MAPKLPPQPTAMPPIIMGEPPNRIPPVGPRWHIAKIVIRSFSLLFAFIAVILAAVLAGKTSLVDAEYNSYFAVYICALPSCILVILWDLAEFITLCARRKSTGRGIHPGGHVGADLILWLQLSILGGILSAYNQIILDSDYWDYESQSYIVANVDITAHNICTAIIIFMLILATIHFFLFVRACIETNQRNRMKNQPIYVIQGPPVPGTSQHPYGQIPGNMNGTQFYYAPPPMQQKRTQRHAPTPMMTPAVPHPAPTHAPRSSPSPAPQIPPLEGYYAPSPTGSMVANNIARPTSTVSPIQETAAASSSRSSGVEQPKVPAPESEPPKVPTPETELPAVAGPSNSAR